MAKHLVPVDGGLYVPVVRDEIREHHARGVAKGVVRVLTQFQATDLGGLPAFSNATVKRDRSAGTEGQ
jgi:hypothetical protein